MASGIRMCVHWAKFGRISRLSSVRWLSSSRGARCEARAGDAHFSQEEQSQFHDEDIHSEDDIRERVLDSALLYVPEFGWTKKALAAGAEAEGLPGVAHGMFPRGGAELVLHLYESNNAALRHQMAAQTENATEKIKISSFIRESLEARLRMTIPYIDQWPQAMAILSFPPNAPDALKHLCTLLDDIWYYAGDRSVDSNWYTKRISLGAVYKSTELCLVQDQSPDFTDTWAFLDRRLEGVAQLGKLARKIQQSGGGLGGNLYGAFHLARNIAGMNTRDR